MAQTLPSQSATEKQVKIPLREYNLLKEVSQQLKRQALLLRILEAEENLKKGRIEEVDADEFIKNL